MLHIRPMTAADIGLGMRLKAQACWNQTEADWRRILDLQPDGCFVAELDGGAVATTATCIFGDVAWVAMVLVDRDVRGRGVGTALMRHSLDFLDRVGVRSIRLDATPLGRPIYERLGFNAQFELARFEGVPAMASASGAAAALPQHLDAIERLDRTATNTDRCKLLRRLWEERPEAFRVVLRDGEVAGFAASRPGSRAVQVGPCLGTADAGPALLLDACRRFAGQPVYFDIPTEHRLATGLARKCGLSVQRDLLRMCRGPELRENVSLLWASYGPELG